MKKIVIVLAALAWWAGSTAPRAQAPAPDVPTRIILNVTERPSTSVAVTWRMAQAYADAVVQLSVATDGPVASMTGVPATLERSVSEKGAEVLHYSAVLASLNPMTRYTYRVGREGGWSEWAQFTTASAAAAPFSFVWFGDPQDDLVAQCSRLFREAFRAAPAAAFWLFSGDMTSEPEDRQTRRPVHRGDAHVPDGAHGHGARQPRHGLQDGERRDRARTFAGKKQRVKTVSPLWRPHYTLPRNGPAGFEETSYTFDYQGVRVRGDRQQ